MLLGTRDTFVEKNNNRRNVGEIWKEEEMEYDIKEIIYIYI